MKEHNVDLVKNIDWSQTLSFNKGTRGGIFINSQQGRKSEVPLLQLSKVGMLSETSKAPYGVSEPFGGGNGRSSIEIEVENEEAAESLRQLDDFIINSAVDGKWFGDLSHDDVKEMYNPIWREAGESRSIGTIRMKIATGPDSPQIFVGSSWDEGTGNISVYNGTVEESIQPHARMVPIIQLSNRVWHMPGTNQFGVTVLLNKAIVFEDPSSQRGECAFDL